MTSLHRLKIRNVFVIARNIVSDALPNTPRIEAAGCTRLARALVLRTVCLRMRVVFLPSSLLFGVSDDRRVIG